MKNDAAQMLTRFFKEIVAVLAGEMADLELDNDAVWQLVRRLHSAWRTAIRRARSDDQSGESGSESLGHPALEELMRLVDVEAEQ